MGGSTNIPFVSNVDNSFIEWDWALILNQCLLFIY